MAKYDGNVTHTGTTTTKANPVLKMWVVMPKTVGEEKLHMHCFYPVGLGWFTLQDRFALGYTLLADGQVVSLVSKINTGGICTGKHF